MSEPEARNAAIVLGLSPTGLYAVRELGRAGVLVYGIARDLQAGCWSRYVEKAFIAKTDEERLRLLFELAGVQKPRPVLIPTSDDDVEFIIAHHQQLSEKFVFQRSYSDGTAEKILAKSSFYKICAENGVAFPAMLTCDLWQLEARATELKFPLMIKPSLIHNIKSQMKGNKGWVASGLGELENIKKQIPPEVGELIVQEIVAGPESEITLYCGYRDGQGTIRQGFTCRKLRQYPPGFGSASLAQSVAEPETEAIVQPFLDAINYQGIFAAEFKRDPLTGRLVIIEINTRPSLWFGLSSASGKAVCLAAYTELSGSAAPLNERLQTEEVRWIYSLKDWWSRWFYLKSRNFILPPPSVDVVGKHQSKINAVFSAEDPAPLVAELFGIVRKGIHRINIHD